MCAREPGREPEEGFLQFVRGLAGMLGWSTYHTRYSIGSDRGFPDLVMLRPPRLIFAELKTQTGKLTQPQEFWRDSLKACDVEVYLWRPSDEREIARILKKLPSQTALEEGHLTR